VNVRDEILGFLQRHELAVIASVSPSGAPEAALVGIAVTPQLEIVFDTLASTRKVANLRRTPRVALVVGWEDEQTLQLEGLADEPAGAELARLKESYFSRFPEGRERQSWPGITYVRVKPLWARLSDFRGAEPRIDELTARELGA
jgi:pyridoxine/pyridoxamine 5'-phosphate oxidase